MVGSLPLTFHNYAPYNALCQSAIADIHSVFTKTNVPFLWTFIRSDTAVKTNTRILLILAVLASLAIFTGALVNALWYAPEPSVYAPAHINLPDRAALPGEEPERLVIPKIGIDAHVQHVGLTASGAMGIPSNFSDVAWYKYGPAPGFMGSAVIDGHLDNGLGLAAVFKHLGELKAGDDVYVERADRMQLHFKVREVVFYDYQSVPLDGVFNKSDGAYLNLITCEGRWVRGERTYDERLIVFTELVS